MSGEFDFERLVELCRRTHEETRRSAARAIDRRLVVRNWLFGWYIVEYEQSGADRAEYGVRLLDRMSDRLRETGIRGTSTTRLKLYRQFYRQRGSIGPTLSDQFQYSRSASLPQVVDRLQGEFPLGWSHYVTLLSVTDPEARRFYEIEAVENGWSVRELKRQLDSSLYQRLALSRDKHIAAVLSDVDELIGSLESLIAKKRAISQAAMQELLTGRTRLPGFGGEWERTRLGDHLRFLRHGTNSRSDLTPHGPVKYLHYGDIHTSTGVYLDPNAGSMPTLTTERSNLLDRLDDGDLVFVDASEDIGGVGKSVEVKGICGQHVVSGLHTIAVRFNKSVLADGFKAYLQFVPEFGRHLRRLAAGTKVYATNRAHVASAELPLPPLPEQRAIATVLSDMDAEIAALDHRLDKTRAIKQGMMQQLLTGSIRLPIPDDHMEDDDSHDG